MANKMNVSISAIDYMQFGGFQQLLNADYLPASFDVGQPDGE